MKLINIFIAIISGAVVLTYILTGFDSLDKDDGFSNNAFA